MFCPNCGSNLPDNAVFCGNCGTALKASQPQQQTQQAYAAPNAGTANGAVKIGAAIMIAVLILFSVLPIIFWFCDVFTLESSWTGDVAFTWSEIYESGDDKTIMEVFRWIGVAFLALNVILGVATLATGKYNRKRTRFITSRFVSVINLICHIILVSAALDAQPSANFTFGNVMFFISCIVLFFLPFYISSATKVAPAPAVQQSNQQ